MLNMLRKHLLVSTAAVFSLTLAPALVSAFSAPLGASITSVAHADGDRDGGNDDNGGDDDHGGNDDHGSDDDNGSDDSGSDDDHGGSDDNGGDDDNGSDDNGGDDDNGSDDDGSDDDNGTDDNGSDDDVSGGDTDADRDDRTSLVVNDSQLRGLKNGTMVAVDQNGRRLVLEMERNRYRTEVKIRAPRNSVTAVTIVPAN